MNVMNITDLNTTDDITFCICTDNENYFDIIIPALIYTIPCGLSILCLMSLMVSTLIKPLKKLNIFTMITIIILLFIYEYS